LLIEIIKYQPKFRKDIINICFKTGYMGKNVAPYFKDPYLFGLLFCLYYVDYEPENCFIAVENSQAIGYILGSLDSKAQDLAFRKLIIPKIMRRLFFNTIWRHPGTFKTVLHFRKIFSKSPFIPNEREIIQLYPAHLHIDVLTPFQRIGIGSNLLKKFEHHLNEQKIEGVHLGTSSFNEKAIQFYYKHNFELLYQGPLGYGMWPSTPNARNLIFGKRIKKV